MEINLRMLGLMDVVKSAQLSPLVPFKALDNLRTLASIPKIAIEADP